MLEALFEPVKAKEDDEGVDGHGVASHGQQVEADLLEGVELVNINSVKASLGIGTSSEDKGVDVSELAAAGGKHQDRAQDCETNNQQVVGGYEVEMWRLGHEGRL